MKSFKSIREGNYVEPGVSEINDVPEDPLSFVEIKPKKTKVVKEGIVDTAANARVRIFSSIDRKKKELYKNAVKEDLQEAVSVKKEKHSWGTMMTVHHGSDTSYPLHPEHQSAIKKLRPGMKTTFKDETNSTVHAHREGDTVHLTRPKTGSTLTSLPYHHFDTSEHAKPVAKKPAGEYDRKVTDHLKKKYNEEAEQMNELNKDTVYSYAAKAEKDVDKKHKDLTAQIKSNNPLSANKTADKIVKRYRGMDRAENRLNKEETEQIEEGDRQALAKKLTNKMYRIGKGLGNLAKIQNNTNIVTNLKNTKSDMHRAVGMANDSTVKKMLNKEETEQISEAPKSIIKLVQKLQTTKRHMVAKSRAKKLVTASKSASAAGDKMTADAAMSKSKRYSNIAKGMEEQMDEKVTSKDIKMAVGVAKDKRYAGGNMSGAVKTMEKMKPGLSKHPRVQQVLKSTNEDSIQEKITVVHGPAPAGHDNKPTTTAGVTSGTVYTGHPAPVKKPNRGNYQFKPTSSGPKPGAQSALDQARLRMKKPMAEGSRPMTGSAHDRLVGAISSRISDTPQPRRAPKDDAEAASWARMERDKQAMQASRKKKVNEGVDFLKIWNGIKPVHEEIKTTHEDPLVVTKDEDGNIHTHANLSVANAIHGTNVKHQAIHTYKKVQDGKFTFELSKHHEGALKEDAPFDPVAHKKELDKLMGKHMAAHTETSKLISAKAPQEAINKAQERNNAVKAEIRAHKDKVPKGPAPKKDGGPGDYYASKKPGEYTGD